MDALKGLGTLQMLHHVYSKLQGLNGVIVIPFSWQAWQQQRKLSAAGLQ